MAFGFFCSLLLIFFSAFSLLGQESKEVAATPQRPSFSVNTTTTSKGWLEFEGGVTFEDQTAVTPVLLKLGTTDNLELFFGLTPIAGSGRDFEDFTIGSRWRFIGGGQGPSLGGQVAVTTFRSNFADKIDYSFLLVLTHAVGGVGVDLNGGFNLPDSGDEQVFGILTLSRAFNSNFSGYGEIFVAHSSEPDEQIVIGSAGGGFAVSPRLVLDGAVNFNISNADVDFQILLGVTTLLSRLW